MTEPTISKVIGGHPEIGGKIIIAKTGAVKYRAVVGWNHFEDTPGGLEHGKIWCWVQGNRFFCFDQSYNRSEIPQDVRDCGVANLTMVRMFHPYWCLDSRAPVDMNLADKARCRARYASLIHDFLQDHETSDGPGNVMPGSTSRENRRRRGRVPAMHFQNRSWRARRGGSGAFRGRAQRAQGERNLTTQDSDTEDAEQSSNETQLRRREDSPLPLGDAVGDTSDHDADDEERPDRADGLHHLLRDSPQPNPSRGMNQNGLLNGADDNRLPSLAPSVSLSSIAGGSVFGQPNGSVSRAFGPSGLSSVINTLTPARQAQRRSSVRAGSRTNSPRVKRERSLGRSSTQPPSRERSTVMYRDGSEAGRSMETAIKLEEDEDEAEESMLPRRKRARIIVLDDIIELSD